MGFVVRGWMVLGAVVFPVEAAWPPVKTKLSLRLAATDPVISQVPIFTLAWYNDLVYNSLCGGVVCLNVQRMVGPSHINQSFANWHHLFGCNK